MTIAYVSPGTDGTGNTSVSPGMPSSTANGDGVLLFVATKPSTATIVTPTGWTLVATGVGTNTSLSGPTQIAAFWREKDAGWSSIPSVSITGGNSSVAQAFRFTKDAAKTWAMDSRTDAYNGGGLSTTLNVTTSAVDLGVGDWLVTGVVNHDDAPTWGSQSYTSTGVTYSAITAISATGTLTGNDVGAAFWGAGISSGSGSLTVQQQATASGATAGGIVLVRLREEVGAKTGTGAGTWTWVGGAVGVAPTAGVGTATGTLAWTGAAVGSASDPDLTGGTDVTNRWDGIAIGGRATVDWEPPIEAPPTPPAQVQISAQSHTASVNPVTGEVTLDAVVASRAAPRTRIVVGNRDVTYWRGIPTPEPDYTLAKPLGYGPATITLPQAKVPLEVPGEGNLLFCAKGKQARVQRVDADGDIIATDWIGFIVAHDMDGGTLTLECAGHAQGRAALVELQPPIFPGPLLDIGRHMYGVLNQGLGVNMTPFHGPITGMVSRKLPGMGALEAVSTLCAMAQSFDGTQWSVHPIHGTTTQRMAPVDTDTIAGTVWLDDAHTPGRLRSDMAEEPNRVYARGITPDGLRVRFGVYPNLKQGEAAAYPMAGGASFGPGTVDADTIDGDGISVMNNRLSATGYRPPTAANAGPAGGRSPLTIRSRWRTSQEDADLAQTGNMNVNTWAALWDLDVTGRGLDRSRVLPAAQTAETHVWRRSATGAPIGKNPLYDPRVVKVDRTVDIEGVFHRRQIKRFARRVLVRGGTTNWLGTISFNLGGLGEGDLDAIVTGGDVMNARALRPGMNLKLANLDNTVVHISALQYSAGIITATVDTRARDAVEVWEVIRRNRESRRNPARAWLREHRGRQVTPRTFDEVGGMLGNKITLDADKWTIFPVVAGLQGTVNLLRVETVNDPAMFCLAIFGRRIRRKKLAHMIGNPLAEGNGRWKNEHVREKLDADNVLVYAAGDFEQPCGYWPHNPTDGEDEGEAWDTQPNGRWQDDASFGYRTDADAPVLWVAIYPDRNTHIKAGRIMWPQLEEGA